MADFYDEIANWSAGVVSSLHGDQGPIEALTEGKNTYVSKIAGPSGSIGTRPRLRPIATIDPALGTPSRMLHIQPFSYAVGENSGHTHSKVVVSASGEIWVINGSDVWNGETYPLPDSGANPFTQDNLSHLDSAVMNNRMFLIANGGEMRSMMPVSGTSGDLTYVNFGFSQDVPSIKVSSVSGGQLPAGTYYVYATFYNDRTGGESNPCNVQEITVEENSKISVTVQCTAAQETMYRKWNIYVQRVSTQAQAYKASLVEATGGAIYEQPVALVDSTTYYVNLSANDLADLVIPMPFVRENDPPPPDMLYVATYGGRLIGASKRKLYWSKLGAPDSFPPSNTDSVDTGEGDEITGLYPLKDEILVIFTTGGTYGVFGNDPQTWTLKPIDTTVGCVGHKSVMEFDGQLAWWSPQYGPVVLNGAQIQKIGLELLARSDWDHGQFFGSNIRAGWDPHFTHLVWALPDTQDPTKLTRLLPYNYRINAWVATLWDPIPIMSMATAFNQRGEQRLWVGDTTNWLGYFDTGVSVDMIPDGTIEGTFTAGSASIVNIDDGSASFYGTGQGLKDRYVNVLTTDDEFVGRGLISSNTGTGLVLSTEMSVTNGQTYRYSIGAPHAVLATRWMDGGEGFLRKRWDRVFVYIVGNDASARVGWQKNFDSRTVQALGTASPVATTATLDSTWSEDVNVDEGRVVQRFGIYVNAQTLRLVIESARAYPLHVIKVALTGRTLSDRYYG